MSTASQKDPSLGGTRTHAGTPLSAAAAAVRPFTEMNARLWAIPPASTARRAHTHTAAASDPEGRRDTSATPGIAAVAEQFERDWMASVASMPPAPDESPSLFQRYFYTWLNPYLALAYAERLMEADFPPPRRQHRARVCGARVSEAFRDVEVRCGRHAWDAHVAPVAADGTPRLSCFSLTQPGASKDAVTAGAVSAPHSGSLGAVGFRGEPQVRGRLRWVGTLRACEDPQRLYAGVEWDALKSDEEGNERRGEGTGGVCVPAYRIAAAAAANGNGQPLLHDGCVHGERLFYQSRSQPAKEGAYTEMPRCSCEPVEDIELVGVDSATPRPQPASFARVLMSVMRADLIAIAAPASYFSICQACNPILLRSFVGFLSSDRRQSGVLKGVITTVVLAIMRVTAPVAAKKDVHRSERSACLFQSATLASIFEKCLSLSPSALADPDISAGRVLTMASSDVENIRQLPEVISYVFLAPLELVFGVCYLFYIVGWSALAGLVTLVISLLLQGFVVSLQDEVQGRLSTCMDRRLRRTNELLSGIRIVKTMGWEQRFVDAIEEEARAEEHRERRKLHMITAAVWFVVKFGSVGVITITLVAYVLSGHTLTAEVAFPVLTILSTIDVPCLMIPESLTSLVKFLVSCRRVSRFLECDDQTVTVRDIKEIFSGEPAAPAIVLSRATIVAWVVSRLRARPRPADQDAGLLTKLARAVIRVLGCKRRVPVEQEWIDDPSIVAEPLTAAVEPAVSDTQTAGEKAAAESGEAESPAHTMTTKALLHNLNLSIPSGKLTVIIGATGSGKSSVLNAVLGALGVITAEDGSTDGTGKGGVWSIRDLAFVPQQPWIMQDTIRANVTFFEDALTAVEGEGSVGSHRGQSHSFLDNHVVCSPLWRRHARSGRPVVRLPPTLKQKEREERLWRALRCCQLDADMRDLANGVDTEIGEKGINLSGGQKARVGLARAVYADRSVYLLDDPLSAVDVHVGRRLVKDVLLGALASKTRVLVTHQVSVLPSADAVVVMRGGHVAFSGSYEEYMASPVRQALETDLETEQRERAAAGRTAEDAAGADAHGAMLLDDASPDASPVSCGPPATNNGEAPFPKCAESVSSSASSASEDDEGGHGPRKSTDAGRPTQAASASNAAITKLMTDEEKESGHVPWSVYRRFIKAGGGVAVFLTVLIMYALNAVLIFGGSAWLSLWATQTGNLTQKQYLTSYAIINAAMVGLFPVQIYVVYAFGRHASARLHASLLYAAATAKVSFFDRTPLGRIVNRFSKDINLLDDHMTPALELLIDIVYFTVSSLILAMISAPLITPVVIVAAVAFYYLFQFYSTIIREIRRRTSIAQSPMFSLLEEVTSGRQSIDAYGKASVLFEQALVRLDHLYSARYTEKVVTVWLSVRIEFLSSSVMIAVALAALHEKITSSYDVLPAYRVSLLSLSLTMALNLFWALSAIVTFAADVEANMNSAQRVLHYVETIPREDLGLRPPRGDATALLEAERPDVQREAKVSVVVEAAAEEGGDHDRCSDRKPTSSSTRGSLEFRHVNMRYRDGLPLVLRDVSFTIAPKEKIGVVGRTGSGKSTLLQTFMRLVEVSGGAMLVDGRPATELSLPALRRLFALIPQDPVLFDGTVRTNVDPFNESTDMEVRRALRLVGLQRDPMPVATNAASTSAPTGSPTSPLVADHTSEEVALDAVVSEGGSNFSVGQRQLLCLARALLKKGSVFLLMDEATANIDMALDRQIQITVARTFRAYTVITIAHRLHTVAGCDRVFVMERGELVEQGSPRSLVSDANSVLHRMVLRTAAGRRRRRQHGPEGEPAGSPTSSRADREQAALDAFLNKCQPA